MKRERSPKAMPRIRLLALLGVFCWCSTASVPILAAETVDGAATAPAALPRVKPVPEVPGPPSRKDVPETSGDATSADDRLSVAEPCEIDRGEVEIIAPVVGENGCGIERPVTLTRAGRRGTVELTPNPVIACSFAKTLAQFLAGPASDAAREILGSPLSAVRGGPGYVCRRRNNKPDGKLSEHARGKALDIVSFVLDDGREISLGEDWSGSGKESLFLKEVHKRACQDFLTVLGPDADENHRSHFHLDSGCHGSTCTYRICQ